MIRAGLLAAVLLAPSAVWAQAAPQPGPQQAAQPAPVQASLIGPGLRVANLDRSTRFYAAALGLVPAMTLQHGPVTEVILSADSKTGRPVLILLGDKTPGAPRPTGPGGGLDKVVMRVADVDVVAARMKAAGFAIGEAQAGGPGPAVLMITDPDGYVLELVQAGATHG